MSFIQPEEQYYSISITLTREFLKWTHTHRLLDGEGAFQDVLWANKPSEQQFRFGGKGGNQFKTIDDVQAFIEAFNSMLVRNGIDKRHMHSLLYLSTFYNYDYTWQSVTRNKHNELLSYAKFILDLISDSESHIGRMRANKEYIEVRDAFTGEFFFAKSELAKSMSVEALSDYWPQQEGNDDIIRYLRISIYDHELYLPNDLNINLVSDPTRKLVSSDGEQKYEQLAFPNSVRYEVLTTTIKRMLDEHERHQTAFHKQLSKDISLSANIGYLKKHRKHKLSSAKSIAILGTLISDYLIYNSVTTLKTKIALILFEYFALFKSFVLQEPLEAPNNYDELISFYKAQGIDSNTIRYRLREFGEI